MSPNKCPELHGRIVMITGATGFIGGHIARLALDAGAEVVLCGRSTEKLDRLFERLGRRGTLRAGDLLENDLARQTVKSVGPDLVINLAAHGVDPEERDEGMALAVNALLPGWLAETLADLGDGRLVHVGSALEYGEVAGDLAEDGPTQATTLYGRTKLRGTEAVSRTAQVAPGQVMTARLFTVYGPGEREGRLYPSLISAAREGRSIALTEGLQRRDFGFVEEVAAVLLGLGVADLHGHDVVNVARGKLESVRDFCRTTARVQGMPEEDLRFGELPARAEEMKHEPVNTGRMVELFGAPLEADLEAGMRRGRELEEGTNS